jgi:nucleotide-binding universal stress UspA family protein
VVTQSSATQHSDSTVTTRPLVVGVDAGGRSASAVVWAAEEAERTGTPVRLVTAVASHPTPAGHEEAANHGLAALARRLTLSELDQQEVVGRPVEVLLDEAVDAAMVVVGQRGAGPAQRLMVGSTSIAVAGRSPVPVVVVPEEWMQPSMSAAPIVVGVSTDEGDRDEVVLAFAFERAERMRVPLIAVSSHDVPALAAWSPVDLEVHHSRCLEALYLRLRPWQDRYPDLEVVVRSVAERPEQAVLDASHVAQLMVVGRHPSTHFAGFSPTSTTRAVLHHAARPVAVVPVAPDPDHRTQRTGDTWQDRWTPTY